MRVLLTVLPANGKLMTITPPWCVADVHSEPAGPCHGATDPGCSANDISPHTLAGTSLSCFREERPLQGIRWSLLRERHRLSSSYRTWKYSGPKQKIGRATTESRDYDSFTHQDISLSATIKSSMALFVPLLHKPLYSETGATGQTASAGHPDGDFMMHSFQEGLGLNPKRHG